MKPRAGWTGHLRISLLTIRIRLYTALDEAEKVRFHQLRQGCHQRLKRQLLCPIHGQVERERVIKGYQVRCSSSPDCASI